MEKDLNFNRTMSIDRFKQVHRIKSIEIIKSPNTKKVFFACPEDSSVSGKISNKIDFKGVLGISECSSPSEGTFYMLHNLVNTPANVQQTL